MIINRNKVIFGKIESINPFLSDGDVARNISSLSISFSGYTRVKNLESLQAENGLSDNFVIIKESDLLALEKKASRSKNPIMAEYEEF
jgi:hypothetical protein